MTQKDEVIKRAFCRKVIERRYEKNLSQLKLAEQIDCHLNTINRIERGLMLPNVIMALRLSKFLDISLDDLVEKAISEINV